MESEKKNGLTSKYPKCEVLLKCLCQTLTVSGVGLKFTFQMNV